MTIDTTTHTTTHTRILNWEACLNARDLGGYVTCDGSETRWGNFVRSDTLHRLTPQSIEALRAYGIRTIIDLRLLSEVQSLPHHFQHVTDGVGYVHLSLLGDEDGEVFKLDRGVGNRFDWTSMMLDNAGPMIASVMRAIADAPEGGVLFHCHAGKDRTGLIAMFLLSLAGVPRETIAQDYALSDELLRSVYDELVAKYSGDPERAWHIENSLWCLPEVMAQTLDYLDDRYGGAESYLRIAGVSGDEIAQIRARLV
jgi:protein-tyrosine phosphatase